MPPSGYNKPIMKFNQIKKKKVRAMKKALGVAKVHATVRVANVSGVRTKKHQRRLDHKIKMMDAGAKLVNQAQQTTVAEVEMGDASKLQKREKAKLAKRERKASKMIVE